MIIDRIRAFLLAVVYLGGYGWLRTAGELQYMGPPADAPGARGYVGVADNAPHWRRQVYRAVYAPVMVAEEEARVFRRTRHADAPDDGFAAFDPNTPAASWGRTAARTAGSMLRSAAQAAAPAPPEDAPASAASPAYAYPAAYPAGAPPARSPAPTNAGAPEMEVYYFAPMSAARPAGAAARPADAADAASRPAAPSASVPAPERR